MTVASDPAERFEPLRGYLTGLAYRMLGSVAEAEDAVQEAYLRWHGLDQATVASPRAFLAKTVTRICLDYLKSARARRERYVGPWLPEPVLGDAFAGDREGEIAHDLSVALLLALERLSPLERAAFLLHDVFDMSFAEVGDALGRSEAACRQLASRARRHVEAARPRFPVTEHEGARLAEAFLAASRSGDVTGLKALLAEDAVLLTDGGGVAKAAFNPILGREKVIRFFAGIARKPAYRQPRIVYRGPVNGLPGFAVIDYHGTLETTALEFREGRIVAIYAVRNPEKLGHLGLAT